MADRDRARLTVRLTPNGGRDAIDGCDFADDGSVVVRARVSVPPEGGKANKALTVLLSKALRIPRTSVEIVSGETSRTKILRIGIEPEVLREKLASLGAT